MASYPTFAISTKGSDQSPVDDLQVDEWPNGSIRARSYYSVGRWKWTLLHGVLSDANKVTLKTFYDTNRLRTDISFLSPWDNVTYNNVMFTAPPKYERLPGGFWNVTVTLRQVAP